MQVNCLPKENLDSTASRKEAEGQKGCDSGQVPPRTGASCGPPGDRWLYSKDNVQGHFKEILPRRMPGGVTGWEQLREPAGGCPGPSKEPQQSKGRAGLRPGTHSQTPPSSPEALSSKCPSLLPAPSSPFNLARTTCPGPARAEGVWVCPPGAHRAPMHCHPWPGLCQKRTDTEV